MVFICIGAIRYHAYICIVNEALEDYRKSAKSDIRSDRLNISKIFFISTGFRDMLRRAMTLPRPRADDDASRDAELKSAIYSLLLRVMRAISLIWLRFRDNNLMASVFYLFSSRQLYTMRVEDAISTASSCYDDIELAGSTKNFASGARGRQYLSLHFRTQA